VRWLTSGADPAAPRSPIGLEKSRTGHMMSHNSMSS